jgi:D-sedoheptulose 7-phosphate isomerase
MKIVFTNGCFDLIHPGHIELLKEASQYGDHLIVGINSDESVRTIKGEGRPILNQEDRANILRSIVYVDDVRIFNELTPINLIVEIEPNVLIKGGDWPIDQIIGAEFVKSYGGEVFSLPLKEGYSTTDIIKKIQRDSPMKNSKTDLTSCNVDAAVAIDEHKRVLTKLIDPFYLNKITNVSNLISECFKNGNKLLLCGNGGSAADCQHIAAEFVVKFEKKGGFPAIALTTDTSILTASLNDFGSNQIFRKQVEAIAKKGDVLLAISTSGNSEDVIEAVKAGYTAGCKTIALTGANGKKLASLCDEAIMIPSARTCRVQEFHILIGHIICEIIENEGDK